MRSFNTGDAAALWRATACSGIGVLAATRAGRRLKTQARGGRYFKYRPPLGRCEPSDGELAVQIAVNGLQSQWLTGSFSVLVSSTSGSRWSFAGRTLGARLWCSGSAVSVRRLTTQETAPPLLAGEARPIWSGQGVREPSRRGKAMSPKLLSSTGVLCH